MTVTNKYPETMDKKTLYLLTKDPSVQSIKNLSDGTTFTVSAYLTYTDTNSRGEEVNILSLMTDQGPLACQSNTFKEQFLDIFEIFGLPVTISKISGMTKAGREYITCTYAGE